MPSPGREWGQQAVFEVGQCEPTAGKRDRAGLVVEAQLAEDVRSSAAQIPSRAAAEPLTALSGVRRSWLTMARKTARERSHCSTGLRSWSVTTTDSTAPRGERVWVALTRVRTLRPSVASPALGSPVDQASRCGGMQMSLRSAALLQFCDLGLAGYGYMA